MKRVLLAATAFLVCAPAAQSAVLFSDNFEADTVGEGAALTNWSVSGAVDVVTTFPGDGKQVDLSSPAFSGISTIETLSGFNLVAGQSYTLAFDYGTKSDGFEIFTFGIGSFGGGLINWGSAMADLISTSFTFTAVADVVGAKLSFSSFVGGGEGFSIDNVSLESLSPVPLPPAVLLLGSGLMGLGALGRKRKKDI